MALNEIIPIIKDGLVVILSILLLILAKKKKNNKTETIKEEKIEEIEEADLHFIKDMLKESFQTILSGVVKNGIPVEKAFNLINSELKKDKKEIIKLEKEKEIEKNN